MRQIVLCEWHIIPETSNHWHVFFEDGGFKLNVPHTIMIVLREAFTMFVFSKDTPFPCCADLTHMIFALSMIGYFVAHFCRRSKQKMLLLTYCVTLSASNVISMIWAGDITVWCCLVVVCRGYQGMMLFSCRFVVVFWCVFEFMGFPAKLCYMSAIQFVWVGLERPALFCSETNDDSTAKSISGFSSITPLHHLNSRA